LETDSIYNSLIQLGRGDRFFEPPNQWRIQEPGVCPSFCLRLQKYLQNWRKCWLSDKQNYSASEGSAPEFHFPGALTLNPSPATGSGSRLHWGFPFSKSWIRHCTQLELHKGTGWVWASEATTVGVELPWPPPLQTLASPNYHWPESSIHPCERPGRRSSPQIAKNFAIKNSRISTWRQVVNNEQMLPLATHWCTSTP